MSGVENRIFIYIILVMAVALVIVCVRHAFTNENTDEDEIPETYYKFTHQYDSEVDDFSEPGKEPEKEPQESPDSDSFSSVKSADLLTPVSCWGDSFTVSYSDLSISYAGVIAGLSKRTVYNIGSPADSIKGIAGRQGGAPLLTTPFVIPSDKTPVEIAIDSSIGGRLDLDFSKNAGLNPCTIKGVPGLISKMNDKFYFTRSESGKEVMVYEPEEIVTRAMDLRREDICIFFVGSDSSVEEDPQRLVDAYRSMADYLLNDKYLVLSPIRGDLEKLKTVEKMLEDEFGDKFVNTRLIFCNDAQQQHDDYKVPEDQINNAKQGIIPEIYFKEANYLSETGALALGTAMNDILEEKGYFDDAKTTSEPKK